MQNVVDALNSGAPVLLPTDTVYGVACIPGSAGYQEIFRLKRRPAGQVLPWLAGNLEMAREYAAFPEYALSLANMFWPGALTLVLPASDVAKALGCTAEDGTVALRMPDCQVCLEVIEAVGKPLACTSANVHGCPAPAQLADVDSAFTALPAPAGIQPACPGGISSTVVDCTGPFPRILRTGAIPSNVLMAAALLDAKL